MAKKKADTSAGRNGEKENTHEVRSILDTSPNAPKTAELRPPKNPPTVDSVWSLQAFPRNTKPLKCSPAQVKAAIDEYAESADSIVDLLKKHKIRYITFFDLLDLYPEIRSAYLDAQKKKAHQYGSEAVSIYNKEIPESFYEIDRFGCKRLSMAGIRYLENKHQAKLTHARIHENGTFNDVSKSESRVLMESRGVQININAELSDLKGKPIDSLYDVLNG